MRQWTLAERQRQSELIKRWKPWEQSTGPLTEKGKARSSLNSTKHGLRSKEWLEVHAQLKKFLAQCREIELTIKIS